VLIQYLGQFDILVLWRFARLTEHSDT